jgi:hypothetical protein
MHTDIAGCQSAGQLNKLLLSRQHNKHVGSGSLLLVPKKAVE